MRRVQAPAEPSGHNLGFPHIYERTRVAPAALLPDWLSAEGLFQLLGPWALIGFTIVIFVECGLFVGMFFPGDTLIFFTGVLVASGQITEPWWLVVTILFLAAIGGNIFGYHLGVAVGPKLFNRPDSKILRPEYVEKTRVFFAKYGNKSIVLARFVPVIRSLITAVAGIGGMDRRNFYLYSAIGAAAWVLGNFGLGEALGNVPWVKNNLELFIIVFVLITSIPIGWEILRHRRESKR